MVWVPFLLLHFYPNLTLCPCPNQVPAAAVLQTPPSQVPPTALGGALWGKRLPGVERHLGASHPLGAAQSSYGEQENSGREGGGLSFSSPNLQGQSQLPSRAQQKEKDSGKFLPPCQSLTQRFCLTGQLQNFRKREA